MNSMLIEVIDRLDELDDSARYDPLEIYAEGGRDAEPQSRAVVCPGDEGGTKACPQDPSLSYVLMVYLAKEASEVWSEWRGGKSPTKQEKLDAVLYYSRHDAFLPLWGAFPDLPPGRHSELGRTS